ncbi:hypothetical protein [Halobacterium hubeiense]
MLKHTGVIDATVGRSSRIGVSSPDEDDEDEDRRAAGVLGPLSRWLSLRR